MAIIDILAMFIYLEDWPTHVNELIPNDGHYYGYCDAFAMGVVGVWISRE